MIITTGINDTYPNDRFITFTEASEILGSGTHTRIRKLILKGEIGAYKIPEISKLRVKKSDIIKLLKS